MSNWHAIESYDLLGVRVDAMTVETLYQVISDAVRAHAPTVIGNHNLHSIYLYHRDAAMRAFYDRATYVFIDGMALIAAGRLAGHPLVRAQRMTSIDWLRPLLASERARGWRVFLLGGRPGVADRAAAILHTEFPNVTFHTHHGFFEASPGSEEGDAVVARINEVHPQLLCVGMGMPRQEHWIADHVDRLDARVVMNLGGFMDLITGEIPVPPRWMARMGLEWLGRLVSRPTHVWRRYLVEPWLLLPHLAHDVKRRIVPGSPRRGE